MGFPADQARGELIRSRAPMSIRDLCQGYLCPLVAGAHRSGFGRAFGIRLPTVRSCNPCNSVNPYPARLPSGSQWLAGGLPVAYWWLGGGYPVGRHPGPVTVHFWDSHASRTPQQPRASKPAGTAPVRQHYGSAPMWIAAHGSTTVAPTDTPRNRVVPASAVVPDVRGTVGPTPDDDSSSVFPGSL